MSYGIHMKTRTFTITLTCEDDETPFDADTLRTALIALSFDVESVRQTVDTPNRGAF